MSTFEAKLAKFAFAVMFMFLVTSFLWTTVGFGEILTTSYDETTSSENLTIDDYKPIETIELKENTITVNTTEYRTLQQVGTNGDITHLELVRSDGKVNSRLEYDSNIRNYGFEVPNETKGEYTLSVINYQPPNPGLFGSSEKEYEQEVKFTVTNGTINITKVPFGANFE